MGIGKHVWTGYAFCVDLLGPYPINYVDNNNINILYCKNVVKAAVAYYTP